MGCKLVGLELEWLVQMQRMKRLQFELLKQNKSFLLEFSDLNRKKLRNNDKNEDRNLRATAAGNSCKIGAGGGTTSARNCEE